MADEDLHWMQLLDAVAYVEAEAQCYRERARELLREGVDELKVRSRTVYSSPEWVVVERKGQELIHSDRGEKLEICREDVVQYLAGLRPAAIRSRKAPFRPISDGIELAIGTIWPGGVPEGLRAKDRNRQILDWLEDNGKSCPNNLEKAVQRVLKGQ